MVKRARSAPMKRLRGEAQFEARRRQSRDARGCIRLHRGRAR
jgi:hypothetical protein